MHLTPKWFAAALVCLPLSFLSAGYYLVRLWATHGAFEQEQLFVGVICANAVLVALYAAMIHPRLVAMFARFQGFGDGRAVADKILDSWWGPLCGVLWAAVIALGAYLLTPWKDEFGVPLFALNGLLALFLFFANILVGFAFAALVRYWAQCRAAIGATEVSVLNISRLDVSTYIQVNGVIVFGTSVIAILALFGLVLSAFEFQAAIIVFTAFAVFVVVAVYLVPLIPLANALWVSKQAELSRVETLIAENYDAALRAEPAARKERAGELQSLIAYRDMVRAIRTMPPNGEFSLVTAVSVTAVSLLPSLAKMVLDAAVKASGGSG